MQNLTAKVSTDIKAPPAEIWSALTDPDMIKRYFFGADVETDWEEGSPIRFKGQWDGKSFEDKGEILEVEPERRLSYTHWSGLSGKPDKPENYHHVTYQLEPKGDQTRVSIIQDGAESPQAQAASEKNWRMVLDGLKECVEH